MASGGAGGIQAETKLGKEKVIKELKNLEKEELVKNVGREKKYWALTVMGRAAFVEVIEEE